MAVNVGTAEIAVVPEMKNFGSQAASGLSSATSGLKKAAGLLGVGLGAAFALSFGKEIAGAANEAERANNRLAAATEGTSVNTQQLIDDFAELGLATAQDDEMLKDLASTLLRMGFKGNTAQLEEEVQAITDLGAATSKGTNIITRFFVALNTGNVTRAISSAKTLGLVTNEQAEHFKDMAAAGKAAEVVQKLLTIAEERGNGAAAAQATELDKLANRWSEFKEELGKGLKALVEYLGFVFEGLKSHIPELVVVLAALSVAWIASGGAADAAATAYLAASYALDAALGPVGLVVAALSLLTLGWAESSKMAKENAATTDAWAKSIVDGDATLEQFNANLAASAEGMPEFAQGFADAATEEVKQKVALLELDKGLKDGTLTAAEYTKKGQELGLTSRQITANLNAEAAQSDDTAGAIFSLADAHKAAAKAAREQHSAELALVDPVFAVVDAVNADRSAEKDLAAARATLDRLTEAGKKGTKAYADAQQDLADKALAAAEAHASLLGSVDALKHSVEKGTVSEKDAEGALRDMAEAAGLTKDETKTLIDRLREGKTALDRWNSTPLSNKSATVTFDIQKVLHAVDPSMQAPWPGGWDADPSTPYPAAMGGIFRPRPGGHVIRVAEAGRAEAVVPLGGGGMGMGPVRIYGEMTIKDWRHGIAELDGELAWGDSYR